MFWIGFVSGFGAAVVLAAVGLALAYRLSPEGREDAEVGRRLRQRGVRAREEIRAELAAKARAQLRAERAEEAARAERPLGRPPDVPSG
jgi:hypothetical protein